MKPIVAIVGRPNVGKSTLFNNLIGDKIAIVDDLPGVTRDRLYRDTEWSGSEFVIVDTGGLEPRNNDFLMTKIKEQAEVAMNEADVILFVVDGKSGLNPLDEEIAYILRKKNKPVILCVNKIDNFTIYPILTNSYTEYEPNIKPKSMFIDNNFPSFLPRPIVIDKTEERLNSEPLTDGLILDYDRKSRQFAQQGFIQAGFRYIWKRGFREMEAINLYGSIIRIEFNSSE